MIIGYARVSTDRQDLAVQRAELGKLGVDPERIYTDKRTGKVREGRPGLREAIAAVRTGDVLVVTRLDRLARSVPDARDIVDQVYAQGAALQIGTSVHDPNDAVGRFLFNALAMVAEFEADLISQRTKEGLAIARAKGRLKGKPPQAQPQAGRTAPAGPRERDVHQRRARRALRSPPGHGLPHRPATTTQAAARQRSGHRCTWARSLRMRV